MSIDTDAVSGDGRSVESLANELGEAIASLPEYQEFLAKKEAVEADEDAQEAIQEFESIREEYMAARQMGQADNDDLLKLQNAQEELHDIPAMAEFLQAQNELELRLQAVNERVSEPLVVDFGEQAGGCCQD